MVSFRSPQGRSRVNAAGMKSRLLVTPWEGGGGAQTLFEEFESGDDDDDDAHRRGGDRDRGTGKAAELRGKEREKKIRLTDYLRR